MNRIIFLVLILFSNFAVAESIRTILPDEEAQKLIENYNWELQQRSRFKLFDDGFLRPKIPVLRPYAEYEYGKYIIFSSDNVVSDASRVKNTILENLPKGVQVLIFDYGYGDSAQYKKYVNSGVAKVKNVGSYNGFWARDGVPVPVYVGAEDKEVPALVDAKYGHGFEADTVFAQLFGVNLVKHEYYFEGGNFLADRKGRCFMVNARHATQMPDSIYTQFYGCKELHRLPFIAGIGHVDERVKIVSDQFVITDVSEYVGLFKELGFEVVLLPRGQMEFETYVNSLMVNGVIYLPVFQNAKDQEVIAAYEKLGFKVFPIEVDELPNRGMGSIHCITMLYPEMPKNPVNEMMLAHE
jgi:hypothetical protein